jgi:hypothetical protein
VLWGGFAEYRCDVFLRLPVTSDHPGMQALNTHCRWQELSRQKENQKKTKESEHVSERDLFEKKLLHSFDGFATI